MGYEMSVDPELGLVDFRAFGEFTVEEFFRCADEAFSHPQFQAGFRCLVDLRSVDEHGPTGEDMRRRTRADAEVARRVGSVQIALVADDDFKFGMIRMYQSLMADSAFQVQTFKEMAMARDWLGLPARVEEPSD